MSQTAQAFMTTAIRPSQLARLPLMQLQRMIWLEASKSGPMLKCWLHHHATCFDSKLTIKSPLFMQEGPWGRVQVQTLYFIIRRYIVPLWRRTGAVGAWLHSCLITALGAGERSALPLGNNAGDHWIGGGEGQGRYLERWKIPCLCRTSNPRSSSP